MKFILDEIGNFRVELRAGLFDPQAFHTGNYTEITQDFYKQNSPREETFCYLILYTAFLINPFTHSFSSESPNISNRA